MSQKGFSAVLPLVLVGLLIAGVGVFFFISQNNTTDQKPGDINNMPPEINMEKEKTETSLEENQATLVAVLEDVSGGDASGTGYILRGDEMLVHKVEANLPDPQGNTFYEGWLVKQEPVLKFFSTGEMVKNIEGKYVLEYESGIQYEGYDFVVITLETQRDKTPEEHILEGLAE